MITLNAQALVDWLSRLGFGGLLVLALVGFQQGWWVFGREAAAIAKDRDEWKTRALTVMRLAERSTSAAEEAIQV